MLNPIKGMLESIICAQFFSDVFGIAWLIGRFISRFNKRFLGIRSSLNQIPTKWVPSTVPILSALLLSW